MLAEAMPDVHAYCEAEGEQDFASMIAGLDPDIPNDDDEDFNPEDIK